LPGSAPGELLIDPQAPPPQMRAFRYSLDAIEERATLTVADVPALLKSGDVLWLDIAGLGDAAAITRVGELFGLHRLALEDVVSGHQRPKVESYGAVLFIVVRLPELDGEQLDSDQLSLFLGENFVVSFQNRPGNCFDPVRERLRKTGGRMRSLGADYLAYALLDSAVDSYFPVLESFGERLDTLEDDVLNSPDNNSIARIHTIKRDLLYLRRATWPQREAIGALLREPSPLIQPETRVYLNDCYDHAVQVMDLLETQRELGSSLLDVWLSSASNRMNEVMRLLTVISTIFIPLTFIVGVYGMNFEYMPELHWKWAYPLCLALMLIVALLMVRGFLARGWLGGNKAPRPTPTPPPS
jgi:magnesium transporter